MKERKRKSIRPRIVQLGPEDLLGNKSLEPDKLSLKRTVTITRNTVISAPIERCFEFIDKQLDQTPHWDPIIKWVVPISTKHVRVGSMSRVTFDFRGVTEVAVAMIRSFHPNRSIFWTSTHSSQLQEEWRLQPEPHGTVVTVTLGYNPGGWAVGRLMEKVVMKGKVEDVVSEILARLKTAIEEQA
ncbi:SRPBCC family protein [Chloroflexota bacterium]